jgi:hypothetical protein
MGYGTFTASSYASYSTTLGRSYDTVTNRVTGQEFTATCIDDSLNPRKFKYRECVNNEEHPNTIPVILALDVTGSMGGACKETAEALGVIITNLYKKFKDIEFCIMGIGDLAYDNEPIQMSQFESDVRIAEALDKLYMEHGGGGNNYESYTAAWYMGLNCTKLDCFDKQNRKGIIITMGDETLNPYLPLKPLKKCIESSGGITVNDQSNIETNALYTEASKKFYIFHIAVNDSKNCYRYHRNDINNDFGQLLGNRLKTTDINGLAGTIEECIEESVNNIVNNITENHKVNVNDNGEISW